MRKTVAMDPTLIEIEIETGVETGVESGDQRPEFGAAAPPFSVVATPDRALSVLAVAIALLAGVFALAGGAVEVRPQAVSDEVMGEQPTSCPPGMFVTGLTDSLELRCGLPPTPIAEEEVRAEHHCTDLERRSLADPGPCHSLLVEGVPVEE